MQYDLRPTNNAKPSSEKSTGTSCCCVIAEVELYAQHVEEVVSASQPFREYLTLDHSAEVESRSHVTGFHRFGTVLLI